MKLVNWILATLAVLEVNAALPQEFEDLVKAKFTYQGQSHTHVQQWCNTVLPSQEQRRNTLQMQLSQAESGAGEGPKVQLLVTEAVTLGNLEEQDHVATDAAKAAQMQQADSAKLALSDASIDTRVLQSTLQHLQMEKASTHAQHPSGKVLKEMLSEAEATEKQYEHQMQLLQANITISHLENSTDLRYQSSRKDLTELQRRYLIATRSLVVLTAALQDESVYMSDLQTICGADQRVRDRMTTASRTLVSQASTSRVSPGSASRPALRATVTGAISHTATSKSTMTSRKEHQVDIASGTMPDEYAVWTPDGNSATASPEAHHSLHASVDPSKMMAFLLGVKEDVTTTATPTVASPMKTASELMTTESPQINDDDDTSSATISMAAPKTEQKLAAIGDMQKETTAVSPFTDPFADDDSTPTSASQSNKAVATADVSDDAATSKSKVTNAAPISKTHTTDKAAATASGTKATSVASKGDNSMRASKAIAPTPSLGSYKNMRKQQAALLEMENVPSGYSAWSPNDKPSEKPGLDLNQMEAAFDSDDDNTNFFAPTTTPAPKVKHNQKNERAANAHPAVTTTPQPALKRNAATSPAPGVKSVDDAVVYDDDDLPKKSQKGGLSDLQGGWQSFLKKQKNTKKVKAKSDTDVQIMQSLYTSDGDLPSQYMAWQPGAGSQGASSADNAKKDSVELPSAADFAKDLSFMQIASESNNEIEDLIGHVASDFVSGNGLEGDAFIEEAAVVVDDASRKAADELLAQYANALKSKPLQQLVQAKLSVPKLHNLWQQLQAVDPLVNPSVAFPSGKEAQASRWCNYVRQNAQSAATMHKAVTAAEDAKNAVLVAQSRQTALVEEMNARVGLQNATQQDIEGLSNLLAMLQKGEDMSKVEHAREQAVSAGIAASMLDNIDVALKSLQGSDAEITDLLQLALQKRQEVFQVQQDKIAELKGVVQAASFVVSQKQSEADNAKTRLTQAHQQLNTIQTSCADVMASIEKQKHNNHMSTHAIGMMLKVIDKH